MLNYISKLRSNSVVDIILSPDLNIVPIFLFLSNLHLAGISVITFV